MISPAIENDDAVGMAEHDVHVVLGEQHRDALLPREFAASCISRSRERGDIPAVGSSISSNRGLPASASASSMRLASP